MRLKKSPPGKGAGKILVEMRAVVKDKIKKRRGNGKGSRRGLAPGLGTHDGLSYRPGQAYMEDKAPAARHYEGSGEVALAFFLSFKDEVISKNNPGVL